MKETKEHIITSATTQPTVLVLGAGMGGLFTAALLSREGYRCTLLEQLPVAGGGLYSYERDGEWWNTGIHAVSGLEPNGRVRRVLERLQIDVPLERLGEDVVHGDISDEDLSKKRYMRLLYGGEECGDEVSRGKLIDTFREELWRFSGGTRPLTDALCEYIVSHGGEIRLQERVTGIHIQDGKVGQVITAAGNTYTADYYVNSLHPKVLMALCDAPVFRKAAVGRILQTEETFGSFKVYMKFKPQSFPYLSENHYIPEYDMLFITMHADDKGYATNMETVMPLQYSALKPWLTARDESYEQFKHAKAEQVIDAINKYFPQLSSAIDSYFTSTSLTYRDDYLTPEGAMYGMSQPVGAVHTKIGNLFLTGQNCYLHGLCGVVSTAEQTVNAILNAK